MKDVPSSFEVLSLKEYKTVKRNTDTNLFLKNEFPLYQLSSWLYSHFSTDLHTVVAPASFLEDKGGGKEGRENFREGKIECMHACKVCKKSPILC